MDALAYFDWTGGVLLALVFALASFAISRTLGNRRRVKEIQKEINGFNAELKKAADSKDEKKVKQLTERESQVTKLMWEMMGYSFKPLLVLLPLFWIAYEFVLPALFAPGFIVHLPFSLPSNIMFWEPWKDYLGARGLFIYSLVVMGMVLELIATKVLKMDGI